MKINEIFYSIQGEGIWAGMPNIFIRFTGCNLRCSYCDTSYAYEKGKELSIDEIILKIKDYKSKFICITGGEPLIQKDIVKFLNVLIKKGYKICIETNGSIDILKIVDLENVIISLDIKCPSSNMNDKNIFENIKYLKEKDCLKFVISDKKDYNYAKRIIEKYKPNSKIYMQAVWGSKINSLAEWILKDNLNIKIGIQLHKVIWGDRTGV